MHALSLARSLARKMDRRTVVDEVSALVAVANDHRRLMHPLGIVFDADEMIRGKYAARAEISGWDLRLSSRECQQTIHWHLVGTGEAGEAFDKLLDKVFERTGGRGDMVDISRPGGPKHWSWHSADVKDCVLLKRMRELLFAKGRRR